MIIEIEELRIGLEIFEEPLAEIMPEVKRLITHLFESFGQRWGLVFLKNCQ